MYILLVDLHILNTYVPIYKEKITLLTINKHPHVRKMLSLCLRTEQDPFEFSKKCNLSSTYDKIF